MAGVRKFLPASAASGWRLEAKPITVAVSPRTVVSVGMLWSFNHKHWSNLAARRKRVSRVQRTLLRLSKSSGTRGIRGRDELGLLEALIAGAVLDFGTKDLLAFFKCREVSTNRPRCF